jgi:hypothetical protein
VSLHCCLLCVCVLCVCTCSVTAACLLTVLRCQNWCTQVISLTHSIATRCLSAHLHRLLLLQHSEPRLFCICACVQNCAGLVVCARHQPHPVYSVTLVLLLHYSCYLCASSCTPSPLAATVTLLLLLLLLTLLTASHNAAKIVLLHNFLPLWQRECEDTAVAAE